LKQFGKHQDGALHHNNPAKIALWESKYIWPEKNICGHPDLLLSIGSGIARGFDKNQRSPGLFKRVMDAFNRNMCGAQAWKELINFISPAFQNRYHRLDPLLDSNEEPSIDDISQMHILQAGTEEFLQDDQWLRPFMDNWIASLFYFEIQRIQANGDHYICFGVIQCREHLPAQGLQSLYRRLIDTKAYFLIDGTPVPCVKQKVQIIPRVVSPFRCVVKVIVQDLDQSLSICLGGITEERWPISGMPMSIYENTSVLGWNAPFGRSDFQINPSSLSNRKRANVYIN
jgi:hypothetical protein